MDRLRQISSVEREFQRRAAEYNNEGSASVTSNLPSASHGILANNKGRDDEEEREQKKVARVISIPTLFTLPYIACLSS